MRARRPPPSAAQNAPHKHGRRGQARGRVTRARVLDAAENLFIRQGYDGTSMSDVSHSARIGVGTVYHHFPDKRALLLEVIDRWGERERAEADNLDFERFLGADPRAAIEGWLARAYRRLREQPSIYLVVLGLADRDPEVRDRYQGIARLATQRWQELIEYGQGRGTFRTDVHPASAALLIHHAIDMAATQVLVRDLAEPAPEHVLRELTDMICRYVLEEA